MSIRAYLVPWSGPVQEVHLKVETKKVMMPTDYSGGHEELSLMKLEYPRGSWQVHHFYVNCKLNMDIVATKIALYFGVPS